MTVRLVDIFEIRVRFQPLLSCGYPSNVCEKNMYQMNLFNSYFDLVFATAVLLSPC